MYRAAPHRLSLACFAMAILACFPSLVRAWERVDGALTYVSAGSATNVWGVNQQHQVWQWNGRTWERRRGVLVGISAASDGTVVGVNPIGIPFRWNGSDWDRMPGRLATIHAVSSTEIWGIGTKEEDRPGEDRRLFKWDVAAKTWALQPVWDGSSTGVLRPVSSVSVDAEGDVWVVVAFSQYPYIYTRTAGTSRFVPVDGNLTQVSAASRQYIMGVNKSGNIWRWNGSTWLQVAGGLKWISVARDGTAWGVNASQNVFRMQVPPN